MSYQLNPQITVAELSALIGLPSCPVLIDVRIDEDFNADPRLIPGSQREDYQAFAAWSEALDGKRVVVICHRGKKLSQGVVAWLRWNGIEAASLDGGSVAWEAAGELLVPAEKIPQRDADGRTIWVTRSRPKIDRIACPWLIRRFVDPRAVFLFVSPQEVQAVADRFNAMPFDIDGVFWSHRGETCTFDTMIEEFSLKSEPLLRLAAMVRGADTARLDLAPQAAGLLAASLGLSQMFDDDLKQLDTGMTLYDAFYRWCRDARDETHNWPSTNKAA